MLNKGINIVKLFHHILIPKLKCSQLEPPQCITIHQYSSRVFKGWLYVLQIFNLRMQQQVTSGLVYGHICEHGPLTQGNKIYGKQEAPCPDHIHKIWGTNFSFAGFKLVGLAENFWTAIQNATNVCRANLCCNFCLQIQAYLPTSTFI